MNATTFNITTSRVWRLRVTWRRRWHYQSTRRRHFPVGSYWTQTANSLSFRDIYHQICGQTGSQTYA